MRFASVAAMMLLMMPALSVAAPPRSGAKPGNAIPKKALNDLKPILSRIKELPPRVEPAKDGAFIKTRLIASEVSSSPAESDFADKPHKVVVRWKSNRQQTKFYSDPETAEKAKDWLPPGRIAGNEGASTPTEIYNATLYYHDGKWAVAEIEWWIDSSGITPIQGFNPPPPRSTKTGASTPWADVFNAPQKPAEKAAAAEPPNGD